MKKPREKKTLRTIIIEGFNKNIWNIKSSDYSLYCRDKKNIETITNMDEKDIVNIIRKGIDKNQIEKTISTFAKNIKNTATKKLERIEKRKKTRLAAQKRHAAARRKYAADQKKLEKRLKKANAEKLILKETLTKDQLATIKRVFNISI